MLKIEYYENEDKKWDGCLNYSCACINTDEYDGYTMLEQIEPTKMQRKSCWGM